MEDGNECRLGTRVGIAFGTKKGRRRTDMMQEPLRQDAYTE